MDALNACYTHKLVFSKLSPADHAQLTRLAIRKTYRKRLRITLEALDKHLPEQARYAAPEGGFTLWVTLPRDVSVQELFEASKRAGVLITTGRHFFADEMLENGFRISISRTDPLRIEEGIAKLGVVLKRLLRSRRKAPSLHDTPPLV